MQGHQYVLGIRTDAIVSGAVLRSASDAMKRTVSKTQYSYGIVGVVSTGDASSLDAWGLLGVARMRAKGARTSNWLFVGVLAGYRPWVYVFVMVFMTLRAQDIPLVMC